MGREIIFEIFQFCDHGTWTSQTDRQTDRQTDDILWHNRALRSIPR